MDFLDARQIDDQTHLEFDICVIGAGAAGITLARQLNQTDLRIVLLESGGPEFDESLQAAAYVDTVTAPVRRDIVSHPRQFGGATTLWGGRCVVFRPIDLEARPWANTPAWPISFEELQRYYERAADVMRLPSVDRFYAESWQDDPDIAPFMNEDLTPELFQWCEVVNMADDYGDMLRTSPNVQLIFHANATELIPNEASTQVEAVKVQTVNGKSHTVRAKQVVLAAAGMENTRLMLASRSRQSTGIGNAHDQVGRGYLDHPKSWDCGVIVPEPGDFRFPLLFRQKHAVGDIQFSLAFTESIQRAEGLLSHCIYLGQVIYEEWESDGYLALKEVQDAVKRRDFSSTTWSAIGRLAGNAGDLVKYVRNSRSGSLTPSFITFMNQLEQRPDPARRVTLDPDRVDQFGLPTVKLDWWVNEDEKESLRRFHTVLGAYLERHKLGRLESRILGESADWPVFSNAHHPTGILRMSDTAQDGVVDQNGCVHGVDNLFVTGSAVFPTVAYANPTFTIVALTIRLANHLKTMMA